VGGDRTAAALCEESLALYRSLGGPGGIAFAFAVAWGAGRAMTPEQAVAYTLDEPPSAQAGPDDAPHLDSANAPSRPQSDSDLH
jgi:hypothetical protein